MSDLPSAIKGPPRALALMSYIHDYTATNGYSPTYREMADSIGVSSTQTVFRYLNILRNQGAVSWQDNKSRTVRITYGNGQF